MAKYLPLFPLNIVVCPGEKLNLHVFEPRYKQLIKECYANQTTFGIPSFINGEIMEYGTELKIVSMDKIHSGGEMDIKTEGIKVFRVLELLKEVPGKLYSAGIISYREEDSSDKPRPEVGKRLIKYIKQLYSLLKIDKDSPSDVEKLVSYDLAHLVGFDVQQEYDLLKLSKESERQLLLVNHLMKILPILSRAEKLKERVQLNGHFKNILPPEF